MIFLPLNDIDAQLGELSAHVPNLLRGEFLWRKNLIELVIRDVAAPSGEFNHPLDGGISEIKQWPILVHPFSRFSTYVS